MNVRNIALAPRPLLAILLLLALFPIVSSTFYLQLGAKIMIMAIFALSLDLLVGHAGMISLGHAAYFGLAAYVLALISPKYEAASIWLSLPAAIAAAALAAAIVGALVVRTVGIYFIMATLAFAQMIYAVFHDTKIAGGSDGIYITVRPALAVSGTNLLNLDSVAQFYYFVLLILAAVFWFLHRLLHAPFGRALAGIRVNAQRMRSLGYAVSAYKLAAFVIAGALAGLAGYLGACQFGFVNPELLAWHHSGVALMMIILGGMGRLHGAVLGSFVFIFLQEIFSTPAVMGAYAKHWQLPMGALIVATVLLLPRGIAGLIETAALRLTKDRDNG